MGVWNDGDDEMTNLEVLTNAPDFTSVGILSITALAPLSLVAHMPGKYYRSQDGPTDAMLYGLLENALGWHIGEKDRAEILEKVSTIHRIKEADITSGVGYRSVLQFHLRFGTRLQGSPATLLRYDDYWSQHLRTNGGEFAGGSREHDYRAIPIMNAASLPEKIVAGGKKVDNPAKVRFGDRAEFLRGDNLLTEFESGAKINVSVIRPFFPRYYPAPTQREYVVPSVPLQIRVETSAVIAAAIEAAIRNPAGPLYLGSNDGWADASWKTLAERAA